MKRISFKGWTACRKLVAKEIYDGPRYEAPECSIKVGVTISLAITLATLLLSSFLALIMPETIVEKISAIAGKYWLGISATLLLVSEMSRYLAEKAIQGIAPTRYQKHTLICVMSTCIIVSVLGAVLFRATGKANIEIVVVSFILASVIVCINTVAVRYIRQVENGRPRLAAATGLSVTLLVIALGCYISAASISIDKLVLIMISLAVEALAMTSLCFEKKEIDDSNEPIVSAYCHSLISTASSIVIMLTLVFVL